MKYVAMISRWNKQMHSYSEETTTACKPKNTLIKLHQRSKAG